MKQQPVPLVSTASPVMGVFADSAFALLNKQEQNYAYYFLQASWEGSKICWFQKSFESPALFILLQLVYSGQTILELEQLSKVSEIEFQQFLVYSSAVLDNCGNYFSFGDSKFVPELSEAAFEQIIKSSQAYQNTKLKKIIDEVYNYAKEGIFNYSGKFQKIGYPPEEGQTGYYSQRVTQDDLTVIDELLAILNISPLNTRVFRDSNTFKVLIASANKHPTKVHTYKDYRIEIHYGDYSAFLRKVSDNLSKALPFAANKNQENMLKAYVDHFNNGDIETHKDSQRWWIKDQKPVIETNIGFIETYLDPKQVRAEFEGFVALVDKKLSERTNNLVEQAEKFIGMLPWPKEFEKDNFLRPDFTSLAVLGFASSGTPLGINIPNYDDIRMEEGFKNVHLGNAVPKIKDTQFLTIEDGELLKTYFPQALFHKVIYHELLGHGSGKLFQQKSDGSLNYDPSIINPLTLQPVGGDCYKATDTWNSKFQNLSNPFEECRADSVALYYSNFKEAFEVLQPEEIQNWENIRDSLYIEFVYAAIQGLQFFNPEANKWGQAHTNGRWVIFQTLLQASDEMIRINETKTEEGKDWFEIVLKKELFKTIGFKAISEFLVKLQVLKATGDYENAQKFFGGLSKVDEKFLRIRDIVIANKKPRRLELQGNIIKKEDGEFEYLKYPETFVGIVQSFIDRFPLFDSEVYHLWRQYANLMRP